jgi:hypothetical protein
MDPTTGLDAVEKTRISDTTGNQTSIPRWPSHCTVLYRISKHESNALWLMLSTNLWSFLHLLRLCWPSLLRPTFWWNNIYQVGFEVFTAVVMKSTIIWDMTPCSPLSFNRRFGGTHRLHLQGTLNISGSFCACSPVSILSSDTGVLKLYASRPPWKCVCNWRTPCIDR